MNGVLSAVDWVIIAAYLVFSLLVGILLSKRASSSTDEYFLSGRKLPWWIAGTSMVATSFAADTPLIVGKWVRSDGISKNWIWWCFAISGMFSVFMLSRLWRRAKVVTDIELTELRYSGKSAAILRGFRSAYMAIPINCITMAWVIVAMIKLMGVLLNISPVWAVIICIFIATVYCVLSGYWGVVITDLVQFALAMGGSIALCIIVVRRLGGIEALRQKALESPLGEKLFHFFPRAPEGAELFTPAFWEGPMFAFLVFISIQWWANKNSDGGGAIIQRMSSTKNERHSLLATLWFNVANYALRPWPWIIVAIASLSVFPNLTDGELAYPKMIKEFVGPGLMGIMIASLLGAFMSTIDTHLNLSSSYIVNDFYKRFIRTGASERHYVNVSRIASIACMIIAGVVAYFSQSIFALFKFLLAFSSGVGAVFILRWFWWRINAWSEISAMIASSAISTVLFIYNGSRYANDKLSFPIILMITVFGSMFVWLVVTLRTAPVSDEKLKEFYRRVRPLGAWKRIASQCGLKPAPGLGRGFINWIAGTVMVLGATFSAGKFLLGFNREGVLWLAAAIAGAAIIAFEVFDKSRYSAD